MKEKDKKNNKKAFNEELPIDESRQNQPNDVDDTQNLASESEECDCEDKVQELGQKLEEMNDKNLRLMAEFDNYRKRTIKEKADIIKNAGERIFSDMLPLVDDFERALGAMTETDDIAAVKEGVELIYSKFIAFLNTNGVKEIPTENEPFDVDLHEAITTFQAPSEEQKGKIIDCTAKGYTMNDKVIRFAKVVVGE